MKQAGYAGKPLIEKLGYQPGDIIYLLNAPKDFKDYLSKEGASLSKDPAALWAHAFFREQIELERFLNHTDLAVVEKGFWVSWPKRAAKISTDLTEQIFRDLILPLGWVDTKVVAIDETWSGLKFLRRKT